LIRDRIACAGLLATALFSSWASAQTPANISVVSGNGQLVCATCSATKEQVFEPMVVLVTDASGKPVPSVTVNWAINSTSGNSTLASLQTVTGSDGTTSDTLAVTFGSSRQIYTVVATIASTTTGVTFSLTAAAPETSSQYVTATVTAPGLYQTITGTAGATGSPNITVVVQDFSSTPIPNISVRLVPAANYTPGASVACATGAGADPGSVLTDATGTATCTPIMGPVAGNGTYGILVGGVANATLNGTGPLGYTQFNSEFIQVTAGTPASIKIISGTGQTANPGQAVANALVAEVDNSGGNPLAGQTVSWSVFPAGSATLASNSSTSGANGQVSNTVTLTNGASGTVTVTASVSNSISVNFSIAVNISITGISKVSGDGQTAAVNTAFAQPLVVQVNVGAGQPSSNLPVQFAISGTGTGTLSAASALTNSSGQASVNVTAGATAGSLTVTASVAGGSSVSFTLTVGSAGPVITSNSFVNGAGFYTTGSLQSALAPCAIATVMGSGIAASIQGVVAAPMYGPLPYQLAGVSITFNNSQAPLYNVSNISGQQQAAFQVPCDLTPATNVPVTVSTGTGSTTVNVAVGSASPGIFQFTDTDNLQHAVVVRPDGSFATVSNPALPGETLHLYVTGIGPVQPALKTNTLPSPSVNSVAQGNVVVAFDNSGVQVVSAQSDPSLIGVDDIAFTMPASLPSGSLGVLYVVVGTSNPQGFYVSNASLISIQ
jgi:uncharacterized protein (TIGR03437 family)